MHVTREQVVDDTLHLLRQLADDWEYSGAIDMNTHLLGDMGLESLGVVILSATVQEHYQATLPFTQFFAEIGQRQERDVTVGEWVTFVHTHLNTNGAGTD